MRKVPLPTSWQWMMLVSLHSRTFFHLVQILRGQLPTAEVDHRKVDLSCFYKPEKKMPDDATIIAPFPEGRNAVVLVICLLMRRFPPIVVFTISVGMK